jgi:hypothetical protein
LGFSIITTCPPVILLCLLDWFIIIVRPMQ